MSRDRLMIEITIQMSLFIEYNPGDCANNKNVGKGKY
jgi:hypothetical protein